jgi:hypothetical protein
VLELDALRIPVKPDTLSEGKRTAVPIETGQSVRRKADTQSSESGHGA